MGAVAPGSVDLLVNSRPEIDPYFSILLPDPLIGWQKAWFFLRNAADASFPSFMGGCPIPHPNWEYVVAQADLHRMQPRLENVQGLLQRGLMGEEILRTFFDRGV
jgi:hypothetical protein